MGESNKYEIAASLFTEEKRNHYLNISLKSKLNGKQIMDSIDTFKLAEEEHSAELLLSKEWQQGYECCNSRYQKRLNEILGNILTTASTKLSASASLDIGSYIIDHLKDNSLLTENDAAQILMELTNQAKNINAKEFSMYDPEMHPDLGEFVMDGKDRLYTWSKKNLQKYP